MEQTRTHTRASTLHVAAERINTSTQQSRGGGVLTAGRGESCSASAGGGGGGDEDRGGLRARKSEARWEEQGWTAVPDRNSTPATSRRVPGDPSSLTGEARARGSAFSRLVRSCSERRWLMKAANTDFHTDRRWDVINMEHKEAQLQGGVAL